MRKYLASVLVLIGLSPVLALAAPWEIGGGGPASNYRPLRYVASASQTHFLISWPYQEKADIRVYATTNVDAWPLTDPDHACPDTTGAINPAFYTVTAGGESTGGALDFTTGHERALNEVVMIVRADCVDRTTNFTTLAPGAVNVHANRATTQMQQVEDLAHHRSIQLPYQNDYSGSGISPILPTLDDDVVHHAIVAKEGAKGVKWSAKSLDDFSCLTCNPGACSGGANSGSACSANTDCAGVCTASVCGAGTSSGGACATNADCVGDCSGGAFTNCDYLKVVNGVTTCAVGTCPGSCSGGGGGGTCVGGTGDGNACTNDADCPDGGVCNPNGGCSSCGVCDGGANDGQSCHTGADCPGGQCVGGCAACTGGGDGQCLGGTNDGNPCTNDIDCPDGGTCTFHPDVCYGGTGDGNPCTNDADCPDGGTCRPNDNVCLGGSNAGNTCQSDADCPGGFCVDPKDVCNGCSDDTSGIAEGHCSAGAHHGGFCSVDADCPSGSCILTGTCGDCGTGLCAHDSDCGTGSCTCGNTDSVCQGGSNDGNPCTDDTDCPDGGICVRVDEVCQGGSNDGDPCTDDADCPGGGTCDNRDGVGVLGPRDGKSRDHSIAVWDGIIGKFIDDTDVTVVGRIERGLSILSFEDLDDNDPKFVGFGAAVSTIPADRGALYTWPWKRPSYQSTGGVCTASKCTFGIHMDEACTTNADCPAADNDAGMVMTIGQSTGAGYGQTPINARPATYPIVGSISGVPADAMKYRFFFTEAVNCPDDFDLSKFKWFTSYTADQTVTIKKNTTTIGTAAITLGGSCATTGCSATLVTSGGKTSFARGDFLELDIPSDATGGDIAFNFACVKVLSE